MEEKRHEKETSIALISLLSVIQSKVGEQVSNRMYVETKVGGKKLQATVDTRANKVYMATKLADEISLPYKNEKGYVKGVNVTSLPIPGVTWDTNIHVGPWRDKVDITIAPLDDQKFYLGMDFLNEAKTVIVPHASTLFIMDNGQTHAIPMRREAKKKKRC